MKLASGAGAERSIHQGYEELLGYAEELEAEVLA